MRHRLPAPAPLLISLIGLFATSLAHGQTYAFAAVRDAGGQRVEFDYPNGVALDSAGNVYVAEGTFADASNHRIRKVSPAGTVSTLAGSGVPGFADGTGAAAQFANPMGLAVDAAGNVYVADGANYRIRKITPAGTVTTLAGTGVPGFADGAAATAQFSFVHGIALDAAGNVYVGDAANHRVRKITPAGLVSTLAGSDVRGFSDGAGATFSYPSGVAVDAAGNVYVAENGPASESGNRIRKITPAGFVTTVAGTGAPGYHDGPAGSAQFDQPWGLALDRAGNLYVADSANQRVRKLSPGGEVTTLGGSGRGGLAEGIGEAAQFWSPTGIAVDATGESLYVANWSSNRLTVGHTAAVLLPDTAVVFPGGAVRLNVSAPPGAASYQWFRNGTALGGQTQGSLLITNAAASDAGTYTTIVTNADGTTKTATASVTISTDAARLINVSCRVNASAGQTIIPSFFVQGTGRKTVLIRAVGPGLQAYGVTGFMNDPRLTLYRGATAIAENDDWNAGQVESVFRSVGAFGLAAGSKDAALVASLPAGEGYTVVASGASGSSGVVLVEVYDADGFRPANTLTNVSVRGGATVGNGALILGFVVNGLGPRRFLIRGAGPGLAMFGVTGALTDPELSVYNAFGQLLATNRAWDNGESTPDVRLAAASVGAFPFSAGSRDAATLLVLRSGAYTAQVASSTSNAGETLAEVYEAP